MGSTVTSTNPADEIPIAIMLASLVKNMCMHCQKKRIGMTSFQVFQNSKRSVTQLRIQLREFSHDVITDARLGMQ
jgi:hypothetical protein